MNERKLTDAEVLERMKAGLTLCLTVMGFPESDPLVAWVYGAKTPTELEQRLGRAETFGTALARTHLVLKAAAQECELEALRAEKAAWTKTMVGDAKRDAG